MNLRIFDILILFKIGLFGDAYGWVGQKGRPSLNLSHISYKYKTWYSYTLPKEDRKHI